MTNLRNLHKHAIDTALSQPPAACYMLGNLLNHA
jgi:hypothetical protein